ncbi:MAG: aldolase [Rhizobiales bacterium]|nr:aldolase [Hyphomicrobiales bacterium]
MPPADAVTIHASCVALGGKACLLRGPSGSGKSDLAFRLITAGRAVLVADDQVHLQREGDRLMASAPPALAGLIELRGLGLRHMPHLARAPLSLLVDLVPREAVPRLPEARYDKILGISLPALSLHGFDLSTPQKLVLAMDLLPSGLFPNADGRIGEP